MLSIHWLYRRSRNSVVKTSGVDVIVTSHTKPIFNMADVNVKDRDSFTATPTLSKMLELEKYARKRIYHGCSMRIEKSVPLDHFLASLGKASWWQTMTLGRIFLSALHTHNSYILAFPLCLNGKTDEYCAHFSLETHFLQSKHWNEPDSTQIFVQKHHQSTKCRNDVYPWKHQFYSIKMGFGGV